MEIKYCPGCLNFTCTLHLLKCLQFARATDAHKARRAKRGASRRLDVTGCWIRSSCKNRLRGAAEELAAYHFSLPHSRFLFYFFHIRYCLPSHRSARTALQSLAALITTLQSHKVAIRTQERADRRKLGRRCCCLGTRTSQRVAPLLSSVRINL